jgi:hypothetical protein
MTANLENGIEKKWLDIVISQHSLTVFSIK